MADLLAVYMDGLRCGTLHLADSGDLRFIYDAAYRQRADATALSLSMPLGVVEHRKRVVLPFLDGLITDNPAARAAIARRFGVSAANPFAILRHTGADVAGALQIVPEDVQPTDAESDRGRSQSLSEAEVAAQLRAVIDEYRDGRAPAELLGRFSLAGAQPKTALVRTPDNRWAVPIGATPTTHILKPVVGDFRRLDVVEHMTMRAAAVLGLPVADSELRVFGDIPTFVVARYDRRFVNGEWRRLHQEDLGQSLAVSPEKKYQRHDGGPGVGDVAQLFRGLPRQADRSATAWAFYQGLMFNTVIQGTDAHIKNYSVMLDGSAVALAPLYDLATFAPYRSAGVPTYSAMRIGKEYRFDAIGERQCLAAAAQLRIDSDRAAEFLEGLRGSVVDAFGAAREEITAMDSATREFADLVVTSVAGLPLVRGA